MLTVHSDWSNFGSVFVCGGGRGVCLRVCGDVYVCLWVGCCLCVGEGECVCVRGGGVCLCVGVEGEGDESENNNSCINITVIADRSPDNTSLGLWGYLL